MISTKLDIPNGPRSSETLPQLGDALRSAGYTVQTLGEVLHVETELSARESDLEVYRRRLAASPGPLSTLIALFALGLAVPADDIRATLGTPAWDALIESGSIVEHADEVTATIRLMPHGNLLIASDRRPGPASPADPLHVTGINAPAGLLAALTVRREVRRALDVGTGNGIQALLAAHHAEHVIATDVNPRALAFAAYNAAINDVANIEFRRGSLFEPVLGESFELIVCNPPYVISPDANYAYRDSGISPAALCREIAGTLPQHLTRGGFGTVLVSWPSTPDADWSTVPRSWLGPDAVGWFLHYRAEDPLTHAANWNKPIAESDVAAYGSAIDRWLAYDREHQIEQISFGAVVLQRQDGRSEAIRCDRLRAGQGSAGTQIERVFAAHDALADPAVSPLDLRLRLAPGNRIDQTLEFREGGWVAGPTTLSLVEGIGFEGTLDATMLQIILALDGTRTGREAAQAIGTDMSEQDSQALLTQTEEMIKELYGLGLLEAV